MGRVAIGLVWLALGGCAGGPWGPVAGGALAGAASRQPVQNWSFAESSQYVDLEVRPGDPYSVTIDYYVMGGRLYVEAADNGRSRWRPMLWTDPRARVRFGDRVFPVVAVEVTEPVEIQRVLPVFYEKDREEPSDACRVAWAPEVCAFSGRFYRLDFRP